MERGAVDTFHIAYPEQIGEVKGLILESDGSGSGPTWECDTITVKLRGNDGSVKTYNFSIYCKIGEGTYQFMADNMLKTNVGSEQELMEIMEEAKDMSSFHITADGMLSRLSTKLLSSLSEMGKTMVLEFRAGEAMAYQWIFRGTDMAEILSDIDLKVEFDSEGIDKMMGIEKRGTMAVVNFPDISGLPEGVSINVNGSPYGFEPGDTVYIYSWNEKNKNADCTGKSAGRR